MNCYQFTDGWLGSLHLLQQYLAKICGFHVDVFFFFQAAFATFLLVNVHEVANVIDGIDN